MYWKNLDRWPLFRNDVKDFAFVSSVLAFNRLQFIYVGFLLLTLCKYFPLGKGSIKIKKQLKIRIKKQFKK